MLQDLDTAAGGFSPLSCIHSSVAHKTSSSINIPSSPRLSCFYSSFRSKIAVATKLVSQGSPPTPKSPRALQRHKPATLFAWEFQSLINIIKGNSKQQPVKILLIFFMPFDIEWPITVCALLGFQGGAEYCLGFSSGKKTSFHQWRN